MNFLAHLYLSGENEDILIGNYLADLMNKRALDQMGERFESGVFLHRMIDHFTDNHPQVQASSALLRGRHKKYSPILVDIFYDYFLARNWSEYSKEDFTVFRKRCYATLLKHSSLFPDKIAERTKQMVGGDWLFSYGHVEGMDFVIHKLKQRVSRPELLEMGVDSLLENEKKLCEQFKSFFPDLIKRCQSIRAELS